MIIQGLQCWQNSFGYKHYITRVSEIPELQITRSLGEITSRTSLFKLCCYHCAIMCVVCKAIELARYRSVILSTRETHKGLDGAMDDICPEAVTCMISQRSCRGSTQIVSSAVQTLFYHRRYIVILFASRRCVGIISLGALYSDVLYTVICVQYAINAVELIKVCEIPVYHCGANRHFTNVELVPNEMHIIVELIYHGQYC